MQSHTPDYEPCEELQAEWDNLAAERENIIALAEQDIASGFATLLQHDAQRGLKVFLEIARKVNNGVVQ